MIKVNVVYSIKEFRERDNSLSCIYKYLYIIDNEMRFKSATNVNFNDLGMFVSKIKQELSDKFGYDDVELELIEL